MPDAPTQIGAQALKHHPSAIAIKGVNECLSFTSWNGRGEDVTRVGEAVLCQCDMG